MAAKQEPTSTALQPAITRLAAGTLVHAFVRLDEDDQGDPHIEVERDGTRTVHHLDHPPASPIGDWIVRHRRALRSYWFGKCDERELKNRIYYELVG